MADSRSILGYEPVTSHRRDLSFEERGGTCRLTFPPPAAWIGWFNVGCALAGAVAQLAVIAWFIQRIMSLLSFNATLPAAAPPIPVWSFAVIGTLLMSFLVALIWTGGAVANYLSLRRRRSIGKFLEVGPTGLVYQRPALFHRYRQWPATDVLGVEIRTVRSVLPRQRVARLVIKVRPGGRLRFQLAGHDKITQAERFVVRAREIMSSPGPSPSTPISVNPISQ